MKNCKSSNVFFVVFAALLSFSSTSIAQKSVQITVNSDDVTSRIDEKIYGHFLEHIYHSVNGGLWAEMVWNRSFEEMAGQHAGLWSVKDGTVLQESLADNIRLWFGNPDWKNYEFTLQARKVGGSEGFLILFRGISDEEFYWCNLGGWGNMRHSLEKGLKGIQWGAVGPAVDGKIEENKWYDIRIRCENEHIQVWLDNETLLDFNDTTEPHLAGRVGIGTWSTKAQYRNIQVKDLDGNILFKGLPKIVEAEIIARHFKTFGKVKAAVTQQDPFNSSYCQYIEAENAGCGIMQENFSVKKGHTYSGSLWLRGSATAGLSIKLLDANDLLDKVKIRTPKKEWKQYKFKFTPKASADNATLKIEILRKGKVYIDQLSMMQTSVRKAGGFRPDLLAAVAGLKPPVIRWPGGCFASPYRWKDAIGPQHKRKVTPRPLWDDLDINSYGTDEFIRMCRKIGSEPLIVVNIGTQTWNGDVNEAEFLQDVLDWIEYCNGPASSKWGRVRSKNGHRKPYNVKYWEIDNETWHMGADGYVQAVRKFAAAMKEKDPSIKLAACGSGSFNLEWNKQIIDGCAELIDYLSIHHYENPSRYAQGPYNYEDFIKKTAELIKDSSNPNLKIYCSEWNAQTTDWRTGLYAGGVLNSFERCAPTFEIAGPALFLRHIDAPAWDNAFINFDHYRWFPAPNYVVMKLWRDHFAPNLLEIIADSNSLNTNATLSADKKTLFIKCVNPTDEPVDVSAAIEGFFKPGSVSMKLIAPGSLRARNTLDRPSRIKAESANAAVSGSNIKFTMPELSAAVLTIKK